VCSTVAGLCFATQTYAFRARSNTPGCAFISLSIPRFRVSGWELTKALQAMRGHPCFRPAVVPTLWSCAVYGLQHRPRAPELERWARIAGEDSARPLCLSTELFP
jgi:hypothetical protein